MGATRTQGGTDWAAGLACNAMGSHVYFQKSDTMQFGRVIWSKSVTFRFSSYIAHPSISGLRTSLNVQHLSRKVNKQKLRECNELQPQAQSSLSAKHSSLPFQCIFSKNVQITNTVIHMLIKSSSRKGQEHGKFKKDLQESCDRTEEETNGNRSIWKNGSKFGFRRMHFAKRRIRRKES